MTPEHLPCVICNGLMVRAIGEKPVHFARRQTCGSSCFNALRKRNRNDFLGPWESRFWSKVVKSDGCWIWQAGMNHDGYGQFCRDRTNIAAHRVSYEIMVGPIPDGLTIDHLCRNKRCVRPDHLEPATIAENVKRGVPHRNVHTHCKHGHAYTPENTSWRASNPKHRVCKMCKRLTQRERIKRKQSLG